MSLNKRPFHRAKDTHVVGCQKMIIGFILNVISHQAKSCTAPGRKFGRYKFATKDVPLVCKTTPRDVYAGRSSPIGAVTFFLPVACRAANTK